MAMLLKTIRRSTIKWYRCAVLLLYILLFSHAAECVKARAVKRGEVNCSCSFKAPNISESLSISWMPKSGMKRASRSKEDHHVTMSSKKRRTLHLKMALRAQDKLVVSQLMKGPVQPSAPNARHN
ncbi:hypothetical protein O6H91_05G115400 [Diphasiastrum complanatum]|uniref:Uncharacterized protein n=1 Tax=Diphasiastrum complanatum TaxID=34168 RepID=A0ACC2DSF7_DIPCM|nr:hypothetical protein O6H91_05G115400 [Diphasiastrum complanatum]